jgi:hypothetical protein
VRSLNTTTQLGAPPGGIALFGARPLVQPLTEAMIDIFVCCIRMRAPEVLAHEQQPGLEEVERSLEGIACARRTVSHASFYGTAGSAECRWVDDFGYDQCLVSVAVQPNHR